MINKRVTLYQIMTKLHSILTKVIPMCTFGMAFTNSNFKIQILSILDSAHLGLLKISYTNLYYWVITSFITPQISDTN